MNEINRFYRKYVSFLYIFSITLDVYHIGKSIYNNNYDLLFYISLMFILFLRWAYVDIKDELNSLNKEFPLGLKNYYHINYQIVVVLSFLSGYLFQDNIFVLMLILLFNILLNIIFNIYFDKVIYKDNFKNKE